MIHFPSDTYMCHVLVLRTNFDLSVITKEVPRATAMASVSSLAKGVHSGSLTSSSFAKGAALKETVSCTEQVRWSPPVRANWRHANVTSSFRSIGVPSSGRTLVMKVSSSFLEASKLNLKTSWCCCLCAIHAVLCRCGQVLSFTAWHSRWHLHALQSAVAMHKLDWFSFEVRRWKLSSLD
jgi:hypothetical protein